jgi:hypothetical protein
LLKENGQYNGLKKTDNTMTKKNREYNDKKKTDNTMAKRKQTIQWLKENSIVLSVFL